jgi:hypothetical protein
MWGRECIDPHFLTSALRPGRITPGEKALGVRYQLDKRLDGLRNLSGRHGKEKVLTGTRIPTPCPNRYANCALPASPSMILVRKHLSPQANYTDHSFSAKLVPTFPDKRCFVVSTTDPFGRILGFLDLSRYFFFQVAPQLYPRG